MNSIIIPNSFVNKTENYYLNFIEIHNSSFLIKKKNIKVIIDRIDQTNNFTNAHFIKQNFLYFLYKYTINDNIKNPLDEMDGGKPTDGFEFSNKETNTGYGVYHCHLSNINSSVLVWYPIVSKNGYFLNFDYLESHPTNSEYIKLIKNIYDRNDNGYNINEHKYFSELKHIHESKILTFTQFSSDRV